MIIRLRARDPSKNMDRGYTIVSTPGLFNTETVVVYYGKYNKQSQKRLYLFDDRLKANKFVNQLLRKRLNSAKRIGVNYQIIG